MRVLILVAVLASVAADTGCTRSADPSNDSTAHASRAVDPNDRAPIATSDSVYVLKRDGVVLSASIPIRFTNQSPDTLYLVNCNGAITPEYEKQEGATWKPFLHTVTNGCLSSPITIAPNATLVDTMMLAGALPGNNAGPAFASSDVAGTYRIVMRNVRWHYDPSRPQFGDTVATHYLLSNVFRLTVDSTR
jgi:hypothetical protein